MSEWVLPEGGVEIEVETYGSTEMTGEGAHSYGAEVSEQYESETTVETEYAGKYMKMPSHILVTTLPLQDTKLPNMSMSRHTKISWTNLEAMWPAQQLLIQNM